MSWTTIIELIGAVSAFLLAVFKFSTYLKGRKDMEREILMKSAERCAKAAIKIAAQTRKAAHDVEDFGCDTPVADGNRLLTGTLRN